LKEEIRELEHIIKENEVVRAEMISRMRTCESNQKTYIKQDRKNSCSKSRKLRSSANTGILGK
jgi:hypothetical protein